MNTSIERKRNVFLSSAAMGVQDQLQDQFPSWIADNAERNDHWNTELFSDMQSKEVLLVVEREREIKTRRVRAPRRE